MPHPVSSTSAVAEELLPLAGLVDLETDFTLCKPAQPEIKVSQLKPAFFFLPDNQIFMDKTLPESEPYFLSNIVPHPSSPTDFVDLHKRVYAPGPDYPEGTYNAKGARISLTHTRVGRRRLDECDTLTRFLCHRLDFCAVDWIFVLSTRFL